MYNIIVILLETNKRLFIIVDYNIIVKYFIKVLPDIVSYTVLTLC